MRRVPPSDSRRRRSARPTRLLIAAAALTAAVAGGLAIGLLGSAAASTVIGRDGAAPALPSRHQLAAAVSALTKAMPRAPHDTLVAQARTQTIRLYRRPNGRPYRTLAPLPYSYGTRPVFRVLRRAGSWLRVSLPVRPNHSSAWVRSRDVDLAATDYRVEVQLRAHHLIVERGGETVLSAPIAVGKALTPTPGGTYFIAYVLRTTDPQSFFGPYAFGLSAYSNVLTSFAGGDGEVGMHGTNEPWLLGKSVSHGCIRIGNTVITRLVHMLPLGTPVLIER